MVYETSYLAYSYHFETQCAILNDTEELSRAFFSIYLLVTRASGAQNKNSVTSKLASEANIFSMVDQVQTRAAEEIRGTQQERHYSP